MSVSMISVSLFFVLIVRRFKIIHVDGAFSQFNFVLFTSISKKRLLPEDGTGCFPVTGTSQGPAGGPGGNRALTPNSKLEIESDQMSCRSPPLNLFLPSPA